LSNAKIERNKLTKEILKCFTKNIKLEECKVKAIISWSWRLRWASILVLFTAIFAPLTTYANIDIAVIIDESRVVDFDGQPPTIIDGRTLVPIRGVFEALGFEVGWDGESAQASLNSDGYAVIITIGSGTFTTNGAVHTLDVPAQIIGGRTLVPLRAILESVGYELNWDGSTQTVLIYSPGFTTAREIQRIEALFRRVLIDGVETEMGFDSVNAQFIVRTGEFEGYHSDIRAVLEGYNFYLDGTRSNASAFRDHLESNASGIMEARSPRYNAVLQRDAEGNYANITFNQMLLIGYTLEEAFQIFEYEIFRLTNQERANHGVPAFAWSDAIGRAARNHSQDMAINDMLGHTGSDGSSVETRLRREGVSGFNIAGENAFMSSGGATPASRVQGWMDSPGHRSNILNRRLTHMGVGSYFVEVGTGWRGGHTQKFAAGSGLRANTPQRPGQTQTAPTADEEQPGTVTSQVNVGFIPDGTTEMTLTAQTLQPTLVGRYVNTIIGGLEQFDSVSFRLETGELPDGLTLERENDTSVAIRGTPTRAGRFIFMISARVEGQDGFIPLAFVMDVHP
jgi:uncharacterized protein YkwD